MIAAAHASGVIEFVKKLPRGTLPIAAGRAAPLRKAVTSLARRGYVRGVLLVPGLPEARSWQERCEALVRFEARVKAELGDKTLARRIAEFEQKQRKAPARRAA